MTPEELNDVFPIDGQTVITEKGRWTVKVDGVRKKGNYGFVVSLVFEGDRQFTADIHLGSGRLKRSREHNEKEIGLILQDVADWLATDPPRGERRLL